MPGGDAGLQLGADGLCNRLHERPDAVQRQHASDLYGRGVGERGFPLRQWLLRRGGPCGVLRGMHERHAVHGFSAADLHHGQVDEHGNGLYGR